MACTKEPVNMTIKLETQLHEIATAKSYGTNREGRKLLITIEELDMGGGGIFDCSQIKR